MWGPNQKNINKLYGYNSNSDNSVLHDQPFQPGPNISSRVSSTLSDWLTLQAERIACSTGKHKLLIITYLDNYLKYADKYVRSYDKIKKEFILRNEKEKEYELNNKNDVIISCLS